MRDGHRDELASKIADLQQYLYARLSKRPSPNGPFRLGLAPQLERIELVRLWQRTADDLGEIRQLLLSAGSDPPAKGAETLDMLLAEASERGLFDSVHAARQFSVELREAVPLIADADYLRVLLDAKMKKRFEEKFGEGRLEEVKEQLKGLSTEGGRSGDDATTRRVALEIRALERRRANKRRKSHTRAAMRSLLLPWVCAILFALTVSAAWILASAEATDAWRVAVAATLGALGSSLSGFFKLRDELAHLSEFRAFRAILFAQPIVGAAAGLFGFLLVRVGVLALPPAGDEATSIWAYGVYGFLLGFSEPFLLGVIGRLAADSSSR